MRLTPEVRVTVPLWVPEATGVPLIITVAVLSAAVGVTVRPVTANGTDMV